MATRNHTLPAATRPAPHLTMRQRGWLNKAATHLVLLFGVFFMFIPLVWTLSTSLKSPGEVYIFPPTWIPNEILWSNYLRAVTAIPFFLYLGNTVFITAVSIVRTQRWKYCVNAPDRTGWLHANADHYVEEALYDLHADPHELENLAGIDAFRAVADDLRQRLIARMVAAGERAPTIEPAPVRPGVQRAVSIDVVRQRYAEHNR